MAKLKVDIHRPPGQKDDSWICNTALVVVIDKDADGKPISMSSQISGDLSAADLMVMARGALEHVERTMHTQFGRPDFNVGQALMEMMNRIDMLDELDVETMTPN